RALRETGRQHGFQAVVEIGVVAGEAGVAPGAHLLRRDRRLGHGLEAEIVERAALGIPLRRLDAVAPPGGAGADPQAAQRLPLTSWRSAQSAARRGAVKRYYQACMNYRLHL